MTTIGKAIRIKGEVHGEEDLVIEGRVDGTIALKNNHLTLESSAVITAHVDVQNITVKGSMTGNTIATDKVEITSAAKVVSIFPTGKREIGPAPDLPASSACQVFSVPVPNEVTSPVPVMTTRRFDTKAAYFLWVLM